MEQFIRHSDPSKTVLLESDLPFIREELKKQFAAAAEGNCAPLLAVNARLLLRSSENESFVAKFLGDTYQLEPNTQLVLDAKKRSFPANQKEKDEILKKMIHFQISNLLQTKMNLADARKQIIHRYELATNRLKEKKLSDSISQFGDAFSSGLDPHSDFLSSDDMEDFQIQMKLSLEGIGAALRYQDGFTVIDNLVKGGSAERAGILKPKDKIITVTPEEGKPVSIIDMELRDVVKLIRGKKGTKVSMTVLRQGKETKSFETTLVRDKIELVDQSAKISYESNTVNGKKYKIGVIELPSFYGAVGKDAKSCSLDVQKLLKEAEKEKVDGIVVNVSQNPGGLLDEAVKISGLFLQKGGMVATKDTKGRIEILNDEDSSIVYKGPLVVLTSRISASASEILAGSLKDYRRAVIVGGDHTFGKGTVQNLREILSGTGGMKVTMGMFFTPSGKSTQVLGVDSDIVLPSILDNEEIGENALPYALPPQKIPAFISAEANSKDKSMHWTPIDAKVIKELKKKSAARVAKEVKFTEIKLQIEKNKKNKGIVKLDEIRKESEAKEKKKKGTDKPDTDEYDSELESEKGPFIQEATRVLIDLIQLTEPQA